MCFYIHPNHQQMKTATKDIMCFKILDSRRESPFRYFYYEFNKLYKSQISFVPNKILGENGKIKVLPSTKIDTGLHSLISKKAAVRFKRERFVYQYLIYEAVIPAGANYYYNPDTGEYVSNRLIVKSIVQ